MLPCAVVFLALYGCALFTKQNAKSVLDLAQVACIVENATLGDATVAQVCGIVEALIPDLKTILASQRAAIAKGQHIGACWPSDAGPDAK
jgi:hypothetical protein